MADHNKTFPNESGDYRAARMELLDAEMRLRRAIEDVNLMRRALPLGGEVPHNYVFREGDDARAVRFAELFAPGKHTLIVYGFMYGPEMEAPCPSCTSIIDSLQGAVGHVAQKAALVVIAKSPIARILEFARTRGWDRTRFLSSAETSFNADYHAEGENGDQWPMLNVFTRREGKIFHTYATELLFVPPESDQDPRHVDAIWPLWNLLDLTPEGRGSFSPKLDYAEPVISIGRND